MLRACSVLQHPHEITRRYAWCRAQAAFNQHADDAIEDAWERVSGAEAAAVKAEADAVAAADEAALAAAEGSMNGVDAAKHARRSAAAAELSTPYTVKDQVLPGMQPAHGRNDVPH